MVAPAMPAAIRVMNSQGDNEKILAAVNASHHAAQIPNKFRGSAIRSCYLYVASLYVILEIQHDGRQSGSPQTTYHYGRVLRYSSARLLHSSLASKRHSSANHVGTLP